jgi:ligand-binding SRPBCC domain-containing protein
MLFWSCGIGSTRFIVIVTVAPVTVTMIQIIKVFLEIFGTKQAWLEGSQDTTVNQRSTFIDTSITLPP